MLGVFRKILNFSQNERKNITNSILLGFIYAVFNALELYAIFITLSALILDTANINTVLMTGALMLVSIGGRIITQYYSQLQRTHAGYFMASDKRISIGEKLKIVGMGYFNKNNLGNITAITTTILTELETTVPIVLITTLGGFLNSIIFAVLIFIFDYRIGIIVVIGFVLFLGATYLMEKSTTKSAPLRQKSQETLVGAVLETIQGMSVIKSFHLDNDKNKRVENAIDNSCEKNLKMEKSLSPYIFMQRVILDLFGVLVILVSIKLYLQETMAFSNCLMMIVSAFMVFEGLKSAGSGVATLRLADSAIDKANELDKAKSMSEGSFLDPLQKHDIELKNVSFAYEKKKYH